MSSYTTITKLKEDHSEFLAAIWVLKGPIPDLSMTVWHTI